MRALFPILIVAIALAFPTLAYAQSPGPMSAGHAKMNGSLDCNNCHAAGFGVPDDKCLGCHEHQPLRDRIKAGKGFHADPEVKKKACKNCHAEHLEEPAGSGKGRKTTVDWRPFGGKKNFEHQRTGWPLQGAHRFQDCEQCHKKKYKQTQLTTFLGLRNECIACHGKENPHEFTDLKLIDCTVCHNFDNRKVPNVGVTKFDHDKTGFPLEGNHLRNACVACHKDIKRFKIEDRNFKECSGCHKDAHRSVISASRKCSQCHSPKVKFQLNKFDHGKETRFDLKGLHEKQKCSGCHKVDSPPEKPKMECEGCHKDIHKGRFGKETCEGCHPDGGPGWLKMRFAHDKKTKFTLTGKHVEIPCTDCHRDREPNHFEKFETTNCGNCHRHKEAHCAQFGLENCGRCHIRGGDRTSKFDHQLTRFPLERAHATVNCDRCHKAARLSDSPACRDSIKYTGLDPACITCHEDVHKGELGQACARCHTAGANFKTLVFDHNRDSQFPLTGFHQIVECATCHPGRKFKIGVSNCVSCHKNDDAHVGALGDECEKCHDTTGGAPKFRHEKHTNFDRVGVHAIIECERCHFLLEDGTSEQPEKFEPSVGKAKPTKKKIFQKFKNIREVAGTPAAIQPPGAALDLKFRAPGFDCASCHPDPHLVRSSLPLDCVECHSEDQWIAPPKNGYHETAGFTLTGPHQVVQCSLCHSSSGSLLGKGENCGFCHVQDDIHAGSFGTDCARCHEQAGWLPSSFTHVDTGYVLEGIHRTLECRSCHQAGNFFIGNKCYNCHLADYRGGQFHQLTDGVANSMGKDIPVAGALNQVNGMPVGIDCGRCHNQFTFAAGTYLQPQVPK